MNTPDTGGWVVTDSYARPGTRCLQSDEGSYDVVYSDNPLTVAQLRALSNVLDEAAAELALTLLEAK
ncbi:hypothetical protein [Streptomyces chryseus]|nr:hypothetical protein [Streptomyces chryseus]GGX26801.1 hypothetical protein GCM10010353_47420 [Streptomyces chryseus]